MRTQLQKILAIAGIATFGAALGIANAAPSGGASGSSTSSGSTAGSSSTTPATPATPAMPASPAQDNGPVTVNPPSGDDGTGLSVKDPNSASNATANANTAGNSANAN